ncbi:MAG: DUF2335 domain-containing protein [Chloroflexota bacterium]|nr:DUF2335 domain-containing protein [Chloroflexota bacterium]
MTNVPAPQSSPNDPERQDPVVERIPSTRARAEITASYEEYHSDILPHPNILRQFDQIVPHGADRFFRMVESQTAHRQYMERRALSGDQIRGYVGVAAGTVICLGILALCVYMVSQGQTLAGIAVIIAEMAVLAGTFIYTTRHRAQERDRKMELLAQQEREQEQERQRQSRQKKKQGR